MKKRYVVAAVTIAIAIVGAVCGVIHTVNAKADKADLEISTAKQAEEPEEKEALFSTDTDGIADKVELEADHEAELTAGQEAAPEAGHEAENETDPDTKAETDGEAEPEAMQEAVELPIDNFEDGTLNTVTSKTDEKAGIPKESSDSQSSDEQKTSEEKVSSSSDSGSSYDAGAKDIYGTYETERVPVR